jgi:hypothetical protein
MQGWSGLSLLLYSLSPFDRLLTFLSPKCHAAGYPLSLSSRPAFSKSPRKRPECFLLCRLSDPTHNFVDLASTLHAERGEARRLLTKFMLRETRILVQHGQATKRGF